MDCAAYSTLNWRPYDALNLAATAVDEEVAGRPEVAGEAFLAARASVRGAYPDGSRQAEALHAVVDAAHPDAGGDRAALWLALDKAAAAALHASVGDLYDTAALVAQAARYAGRTRCRDSLCIVLDAIREQAVAGSRVTA